MADGLACLAEADGYAVQIDVPQLVEPGDHVLGEAAYVEREIEPGPIAAATA